MSTYSFFNTSTGVLLAKHFAGPLKHLSTNTPPGHAPIVGYFDHLSQRVDLDVWHQLQTHRATSGVRAEDEAEWQAVEKDLLSRLMVDYQPPAPAGDYEWIHDVDGQRVRRWKKTAEIQVRDREDAQARAELKRLDEAMLRPLGELAIDPNNTDALMRIDFIVARKLELRANLKR